MAPRMKIESAQPTQSMGAEAPQNKPVAAKPVASSVVSKVEPSSQPVAPTVTTGQAPRRVAKVVVDGASPSPQDSSRVKDSVAQAATPSPTASPASAPKPTVTPSVQVTPSVSVAQDNPSAGAQDNPTGTAQPRPQEDETPSDASRVSAVRHWSLTGWVSRTFPGHEHAFYGAILALLLALLVFAIGILRVLFIVILVIVGIAVGQVLDGDPKIIASIRALFSSERERH